MFVPGNDKKGGIGDTADQKFMHYMTQKSK